MKNFEDY